jgi:ribose 5-phosphate isomerase B
MANSKLVDLLWGSDHRGLELKEYLSEYVCPTKIDKDGKFNIATMYDVGTYTNKKCNYPDIVKKFHNHFDIYTHGILICGSGFGVCMAANRFKHIRAATCRTVKEVEIARKHNNINVLCLGANFTSKSRAKGLVKTFFQTDFENGRHKKRINILKTINK